MLMKSIFHLAVLCAVLSSTILTAVSEEVAASALADPESNATPDTTGGGDIVDFVWLNDILSASSSISPMKVGLGAPQFKRYVLAILNDKLLKRKISGKKTSPEQISLYSLAVFRQLAVQLAEIKQNIVSIDAEFEKMAAQESSSAIWFARRYTPLRDTLHQIESMFERFSLYTQNPKEIEAHTLHDFAHSVVSHQYNSVLRLLNTLQYFVRPDSDVRLQPDDEQENEILFDGAVWQQENAYQAETTRGVKPTMFELLERVIKNTDPCSLSSTPQQLFLGMFFMVALAQTKGFAMVDFSYQFLKTTGKGNFTLEREVSANLEAAYSKAIQEAAKATMATSGNTLRRCDARTAIQGETYVMFTEILQAQLENEINMNNRGTCMKKCRHYEHSTGGRCFYPSYTQCDRQKLCKGTLHDCKFVKAHAEVCLSSNPYRRYEWIDFKKGPVLGDKKSGCPSDHRVGMYSWINWFVRCDTCLCLCDDRNSPTSDRFVSLLPAVTDLEKNMVMTGIKFSKHRRVIMLEVQQGVSLPDGRVKIDSLDWVELPNIDVRGKGEHVAGIDYHVLVYESRALDLDNLEAPPGHVITGAKFRMLGTHLNLEIRVTPIDFHSGKLRGKLSYWLSNDATTLSTTPRTELVIKHPDNPAKISAENIVDSHSNSFVVFRNTDLTKDAAQMTVPYFDAQALMTVPPAWIAGINLHYKTSGGSGGYVAFQVELVNATEYFH